MKPAPVYVPPVIVPVPPMVPVPATAPVAAPVVMVVPWAAFAGKSRRRAPENQLMLFA